MSIKSLLTLFNEGKYNEAEFLLTEPNFPNQSIYKAFIANFRSRHRDALQYIAEYEKSLTNPTVKEKILIISCKSQALYRLYQFEEFNILIQEGENLILNFEGTKDIEQIYWEGNLFLLKGYYFGLTGSFSESLENLYKAMEYYKNLDFPYLQAIVYSALGEAYAEIRDYEKANEFFEIGLNKLKSVEISVQKGHILSHLGFINEKRGNLIKAEYAYKQSIDEFNKTENPMDGYFSHLRLGNLISLKGKLDEAEAIFDRIYRHGFDHGFKIQQYLSLFNLGLVYKKKGNYDKSIEYLHNALKLQYELDNHINISDTLLEIVRICLYSGDKDIIEETMNKFEELVKLQATPIVEQRYQIAKALILKSQSRLKEKLEAQLIFEKIVEDRTIEEFEIKTIALVNLCDILVFEIKNSQDVSLLNEVYAYVDQIENQANQNNAVVVQLEALFLRSKFLIAENKVIEGIETLNNVYAKTEELGLEELRERVFSEIQNLKSEVQVIQNVDAGMKLEEKNMSEIEEYLNDLNKFLR